MDKLPKHIADMVGIIDGDGPSAPVITRRDKPMVSIAFEPDGTITIAYDGKALGWINEVRNSEQMDGRYRAVTTAGTIGYFWSIDTARDFLFTEAF